LNVIGIWEKKGANERTIRVGVGASARNNEQSE